MALYFAYGANMAHDVFTRRRRIFATSAEAARLPDYVMRFSTRGLRWVEPAFANIEPQPGAECWGALYAITDEELQHIALVESASYELVELEVDGMRCGAALAQAFVARRPFRGQCPSRRYRDLMLQGAREHGLPQTYCDALAAHAVVHVPLASNAFRALLESIAVARRLGLYPEHATMRAIKAWRALRRWL